MDVDGFVLRALPVAQFFVSGKTFFGLTIAYV
jgi:hypothetical protein